MYIDTRRHFFRAWPLLTLNDGGRVDPWAEAGFEPSACQGGGHQLVRGRQAGPPPTQSHQVRDNSVTRRLLNLWVNIYLRPDAKKIFSVKTTMKVQMVGIYVCRIM
jgi:hypothetical protein